MRKLIAAAAGAALLAVTFGTPAEAGRRWHHHHDDVDAGDVVAGAFLVGGIAALASAIGEGSRRNQDAAVDSCSREAENRLEGHVTDITAVNKRKGYYIVEGNVEGAGGFSCTVRNGSIYGFRSARAEA